MRQHILTPLCWGYFFSPMYILYIYYPAAENTEEKMAERAAAAPAFQECHLSPLYWDLWKVLKVEMTQ